MAEEGEKRGSALGTLIKVLALVAGIPAALAAGYQLYAVATGKTTIQEYLSPVSKPAMVIVASQDGSRRAVATAEECAAPSEKTAWEKAKASKARADYNSYILAYANCPNAATARDALLTCRNEMREAWEETPIKSNQGVRGVGSIPENGKTTEAACNAAKAMARKQAQANCEAIASGGGYRNPKWNVGDQDCACNKASDIVTVCVADFAASCSWEAKIQRQVEICG